MLWLATGLSYSPGLRAQSNEHVDSRPNIICIVTEDISPFLGCYGDKVAHTPHIDSLAAAGIRYAGMYTTIGVCAPSRYSLITGRYAVTDFANNMRAARGPLPGFQVVPPAAVKCFTELLRRKGYYCTNNDKTDYQFDSPLTAWDENGKSATWKHCPAGQPFFAIFNLPVTHESRIWQRADERLTITPEEVKVPPYYPDVPQVRKDLAVLYTNIEIMDRQTGELINELRQANKLNNTIIIWYSDNGGPMPRGKREIYETGAHVPFIIRLPGGKSAGQVDSALHMFIDIPATILSLAGIRPPAFMHGQAFLGEYRAPEPRKYVYGFRNREGENSDKQGAVRDSRFRYVRNYQPDQPDFYSVQYRFQMPMMKTLLKMHMRGELNTAQEKWFRAPRPLEEFYDVAKDPYELNNLIDDPRYVSQVEKLRTAYEGWLETYNSRWMAEEIDQIKMQWPGGIQPETARPVLDFGEGRCAIHCATPGSSVAYKINKAAGNGRWMLYWSPFKVERGDTVEVLANRIGYKPSRMTEAVVR